MTSAWQKAVLVLLAFLCIVPNVFAQSTRNGAVRAEKIFEEAHLEYAAHSTNVDAAWHFARAAFDWAEFARSDKERAEIAEQGIAAARFAMQANPKLAAGPYYLGMNLGQLARTKSIGALKIVVEMEREFLSARLLDEKFDYAGPDRNLGLLYLEAPTFSVGNRLKAREHLHRAVELCPTYPENRLNLIEAYLRADDIVSAEREMKPLKQTWDKAKMEFTGEQWQNAWVDWEARRKKIEERLARAAHKRTHPGR